ncbi:unnamed protein product (macronuclear) [Paramecium tetraurelia]|uniref:polynucleotide adenylyltransferase n=1 Tax=Paramecium tetraurelia TaxID=5888 RepID=A0EFV4_PARTE|nr:uncharacterized protein GSPATT00026518001 [Paramecium tetraurelia]CAK94195.1 unnamed protein product [Paramecium tetraurelia]|eukprot:XP_001461568.1 hypothetical protein (macronuclear) [Paramecium tetraurelia strain d4-2]
MNQRGLMEELIMIQTQCNINAIKANQLVSLRQSLFKRSRKINRKAKRFKHIQEKIVKKWSQQCAKEKRINEDHLKYCSAVLLPYGSVLLGVADSKSDIDLICIAPEFIDRREQFFNGLFYLLSNEQGMEQINKIESTSNPIIKMIYKGFHIDINFAQLNSDRVPENIDDNLDELRRNLLQSEDKSLYALNGRKNGILISKSMPDHSQFVQALRIIKQWAKKRKVSSNIIGYLGGISWAILMAKICQLFPRVDVCQTVSLFFQIYSQWNWKIPVVIDESEQDFIQIETFKTLCWKRDEDKRNDKIMQIITPAYPFFNTTFKVNKITFQTIFQEFQIGAQKLGDWNEVLRPLDFFDCFQYFVAISIVSKSSENFHKWTGFCEAQLPKLLKLIGHNEAIYDNTSFELRITPDGEENLERDYAKSLTYFLGIKKLKPDAWPLFLRIPITQFAIELNQRKLQSFKNEEEFNMKIYVANVTDIDQLRGKLSPRMYDDSDCIVKKIKMNEEDKNGSAYLVKRVSSIQSSGINQDVLNDMF